MRDIEKISVKEYYILTKKLIQLDILTNKEAVLLMIMFVDASLFCSPKSKEIDKHYNTLIDISIDNFKNIV